MKRILHWRPSKTQARFIKIGLNVLIVVLLVILAYKFAYSVLPFSMWLPLVRFQTAISNIVSPLAPWVILFVVALSLLIGGYSLGWTWTGFGSNTHPKTEGQEFQPAKTLWDWMQLLLIPIVIAGSALLFNYWSTTTQNQIALDNQREAALQAYLDKMSTFMLDRNLRTSRPDDDIRIVARTSTLSVLTQLDGTRKGTIIQFLWESKLISNTAILDLTYADLSGMVLISERLDNSNLSTTNLMDTDLAYSDFRNSNLSSSVFDNSDLEGVNFTGADLSGATLGDCRLLRATLTKANLSKAYFARSNLQWADFTGANLTGAMMYQTDLQHAILTPAQLATIGDLRGATLPDGSKHE